MVWGVVKMMLMLLVWEREGEEGEMLRMVSWELRPLVAW